MKSATPTSGSSPRQGPIDKGQTNTALDLFDQVQAMTWRLINPKQ